MLSKLLNTAARVKSSIVLGRFSAKLADIEATSYNTLRAILTANQESEFGRKHAFRQISSASEFAAGVPLTNYEGLATWIEKARFEPQVLTTEPIIHWLQSSGTSGDPKLIPHTTTSIKRYSIGTARGLYGYIADQGGRSSVMSGKILVVAAPAEVNKINGIPAGYASGMAATRNRVLQAMMVLPKSIIDISDHNRKQRCVGECVIQSQLTAVTGVTSASLNTLTYIRDQLPAILEGTRLHRQYIEPHTDDRGRLRLDRLWPRLQLFASSGVVLEHLRPRIHELLGPSITITEYYAASEGAFAFNVTPNARGMTLNLDLYYFEFIPETNGTRNGGTLPVPLWQVERGKRYELVITAANGLYRYPMADIVEFVETSPPMIKFVGRRGGFVNIASEKLHDAEVARAVSDVCDNFQVHPIGFFFTGWLDKENTPRHCLAIEFDEDQNAVDARAFIRTFSERLADRNPSFNHVVKGNGFPPHHVVLAKGSRQRWEHRAELGTECLEQKKAKNLLVADEFLAMLEAADVKAHDLPPDFWADTGN